VRVFGWQLGPADTAALCHALRPCTHVISLVLSGTALTAVQVYSLARVLPATSVRYLSLDFNPLAPATPGLGQPGGMVPLEPAAGASASASALPHSGSAAAIPPSSRPSAPGSKAASPVPPASPPPPDTARGDVSPRGSDPTPRDGNGVHAFAALLRRGSQLNRLSLRGEGLNVRDAAHIADALRFNTALQELVLSDNDLGDDGATAICAGLRDNRSLRSLSLANNHLTAAW